MPRIAEVTITLPAFLMPRQVMHACVAEVDQLIHDLRHSTLSREANLDLFRDTFERREDAELCIGCAEAVLDAIIPH